MTTTTLAPEMSLSIPRPNWWRPAVSLCHRELVRFLRQRHRVIGSLATPIVFWLFIGLGLQHSFNGSKQVGGGGIAGGGYMEYFFPGTILFILLSTAIFSTISIIEDRREGFLQSVLVAPVSRMSIVLGKVLGGGILAMGQACLFLLLAPTVGIHFTLFGLLGSLLMMALMAFSLTALGFCIAWRMVSTQGFHAVMNLFLMPMWFLSGAIFPASGAGGPLRYIMLANPLTYGLDGLRRCLYLADANVVPTGPGLGICTIISVAFAVIIFLVAASIANKKITPELL